MTSLELSYTAESNPVETMYHTVYVQWINPMTPEFTCTYVKKMNYQCVSRCLLNTQKLALMECMR